MFWLLRRLFWFGSGATLGFGGAMWVRNRVRRAVVRYVPERVSTEVADGVRKVGGRLGTDVRQARTHLGEALAEGRAAMRDREARLRDDLAIQPRSGERQRKSHVVRSRETSGGH